MDLTIRALQEAGLEILNHFPPIPGACAMMSAIYAGMLKDQGFDAQMIAGALYLEEMRLFGEHSAEKATFEQSNLDWDGHCWIQLNDLIADISLFRTVYSSASGTPLKQILEKFGEGKSLLISSPQGMKDMGLRYEAQYTLTDEQVDNLIRGAFSILKEKKLL